MRKLLWTFLIVSLTLVFSCGKDGQTGGSSGSSTGDSSPKAYSLKYDAGAVTRGNYTKSAGIIPGSYRGGELLVKFKSGVTSSRSAAIHKSVNARVAIRYNVVDNLMLVELPSGTSVTDAVAQYSQNSDVEYAEPNYIARGLDTFPNDPYFTNQYALYNTGAYKNGTPGADIKAYKAWDVSTGSKNVVVAVLDTGVDYNHPDLSTNMWVNPNQMVNGIDVFNGYANDIRGWNFVGTDPVNPTANNDPMDTEGHGTHVSGTIGAIGNNSTGVAGVNWRVTIMPLKVINSDLTTDMAAVISAVQYAVNMGAKLMNMSFGWKTQSQAVYNALASARTSGVLIVAAAGNGVSLDGVTCNGNPGEGTNNDLSPCYPGSYNLDNIISVAASDEKDMLATFSNYGITTVDVAAPGVDICSSVSGYSGGTLYDCNYSGTSMASPHVTGLAALLWSYYTNFTYTQVRQMIMTYVDPLPAPYNGMIVTGGRINAWRAMSSLWAPTNLQVTNSTAGSVTITWQNRATDASAYDVYRKDTGSYALLTTLPANSQTLTDTAAVAGTQYTYKLNARNAIGTSPDSTAISVSAVAPTPAPATSGGGGGGGCSIVAPAGTGKHSAGADVAFILIPAIALLIKWRRRR